MTLRHTTRDGLRPLCIFIENTLRKSNKAQRFRRLQHRLFGLTETEWRMLGVYLSCWETMDVGVQRQRWIAKEISRLESELEEVDFDEKDPDMVDLAFEWWEMREEAIENMNFCDQTLGLLREAQRGVAHTPVYRELGVMRQNGMWYWSPWFRETCSKENKDRRALVDALVWGEIDCS